MDLFGLPFYCLLVNVFLISAVGVGVSNCRFAMF